jgi:hypothetical protein
MLFRMVIIATFFVAPAAAKELVWVDVNDAADWGGRDIGCTPTATPYSRFCSGDDFGRVATCWDVRTEGWPGNSSDPQFTCHGHDAWCTYKGENQMKIATPHDGHAQPGKIYVCGHVIKARQ